MAKLNIKNTKQSKSELEATERENALVRELVGKIRSGDQTAFRRLVDLYRQQVAALAFKMVGDYDEAADIAQTVFVKMAKNIWRYDEKKKFYTWLYRITVNASIDHMRKHKRHRHEPLENFHETIQTTIADPEVEYRRRQIQTYIAEATDSLNEKQRSAFILRDIEGCKIDDVAKVMEMPEATVRWYLHRARAKIKKELTRKYPQLLMLFGLK